MPTCRKPGQSIASSRHWIDRNTTDTVDRFQPHIDYSLFVPYLTLVWLRFSSPLIHFNSTRFSFAGLPLSAVSPIPPTSILEIFHPQPSMPSSSPEHTPFPFFRLPTELRRIIYRKIHPLFHITDTIPAVESRSVASHQLRFDSLHLSFRRTLY